MHSPTPALFLPPGNFSPLSITDHERTYQYRIIHTGHHWRTLYGLQPEILMALSTGIINLLSVLGFHIACAAAVVGIWYVCACRNKDRRTPPEGPTLSEKIARIHPLCAN